uniref:Ig-like domain-containing protein n=1 Tax=Leptobrachium leishanense TaxID=445787 RepID=A0A8C5MR89_9ANUR
MEEAIGLVLLLFLQSGGALELYGPSTQRARRGSDTSIPCTFTVDKTPVDPKHFVVFWYLKGNEILSYNRIVTSQDSRFSLNTINSLNGDASLSISRVMMSDKGVYTCSIIYSPERKEKEVTLLVQAPPEINITERLVVTNRQSILGAAITGFYPGDINVKWLRDGETLNNHKISTPQRNRDGTYSVTSTVTIIPTMEDRHQTFSCRVQHDSISEPLHEDFQLEFAAPPEVKVSGRHVDINEESVLSCLITGFYPADIDIKWLKDEEIMDHVSENRPQRNPNGTYSVTSTVTITPTEEDKHRTFSCRVQHEALSNPVQETFQLQYAGLTFGDSTRRPVILEIVAAVILLIVIAGVIIYTYRFQKGKQEKRKTQENGEEFSSLIGDSPHVEDIEILNQLQWQQEVTLQCYISNYYPVNPTVTWHRYDQTTFNTDRKPLPKGYMIQDLQHEKQWDDTYRCTARLVFTPSPESDDGAVFLCRVKHPNLKGRIVKISKPLQIMGECRIRIHINPFRTHMRFLCPWNQSIFVFSFMC